MKMKLVLLALALVAAPSVASAQCSGGAQFQPGKLCGNSGAALALPGPQSLSPIIDRNFGAPSAQGTILNRGASTWSATAQPILGVNGVTGGQVTLNGSTNGAAVLKVAPSAGTVNFQLPTTNGSANFVLITDGSGNTSWVNNVSGGTVQSVGLALPAAVFSISGSPVTGTGTLTGSFTTQNSNLVWAGPISGVAATPTFRSLVGADLPNPSSSTLGGIRSAVAVANSWVSSISTAGIPGFTQPNFTNIAGAITAAQCVNPTVSTIGCVEAFTAVSHEFLTSITTAGVPVAAQPAFSDLSGTASLVQLPAISTGTILGNNSGATQGPTAITTSQALDFVGSVQGNVLYRTGTIWAVLPPGTNGQVLTTGGTAANPSWTTVTGTGTVTSVATNNGLTGGPVTTTGTIGLAALGSHQILANNSGGLGVPTGLHTTDILDFIDTTQGDVLYRGASAWLALAPGTTGQFLQTQGAGSTPQWASAVNTFNARAGTVVPLASDYGNLNGLALNNLSLAASATASALTITLNDAAGSTPTATSPAVINFRSNTGTTGTTTALSVTASTTLVVSSGSTLGVTSATAFRLWVVGFNDAGTFRLGVINCSTATQIFALNEGALVNSTAEGGAGAADSAGVFYTGTAVTAKPYRILGYLEWSSSGLVTAGTWTITNLAFSQVFGPGIKKPGDVMQTAYATATGFSNTGVGATFVDAGSVAITPTSPANLIKFQSSFSAGASNVAATNTATGVRGINNAVTVLQGPITFSAPTGAGGNGSNGGGSVLAYDKPNSSGSALTYKIQANSNNTSSITSIQNINMILEEIQG